ncbi:MAG: V-type ATPase subunit [Candidatus Thorarchaeota archaeon]
MTLGAANVYGFVNARIRALKSRFLSVGDYERLLQSKSYEEFIKILSGSSYGPAMNRISPGKTLYPDDLALFLSREFAEVVYNLSRSLTGKVQDFSKTYMEMFLAESVKTILRGIHVGLDRDEILRFTVPTSPSQIEEFETLINVSSVNSMIDILPYWDIKIALLTRVPQYEEFDSTAPLEVAVEEWYLRKVMDALVDFSNDDKKRVLNILEARVDLRNVLTVLRALALGLDSRVIQMSMVRFTRKSRALMESLTTSTSWRDVFSKLNNTHYSQIGGRLQRLYEDTNDLSEVELAIEDYIAKRVLLQLTAFPFHLGTIIGFFNLKYYEVRNIRSIAVGIERGETADTIRRMITLW